MPLNISFRKYQPSDYAEFEQMVLALYEEDDYGLLMTREKIARTVEELGTENDQAKIMMFTMNDEVIGYAILIYFWSNEYGGFLISIDEMYVEQQWRNLGVGRGFFEYIEAHRPDKAVGMMLEVTPMNKRAMQFYERMGFMKSGNVGMVKVF